MAFLCVSNANAQTEITGRVLDQVSGESLVGASVYLEEYATGGMTDFDGNFRFSTRQTGEAHSSRWANGRVRRPHRRAV